MKAYRIDGELEIRRRSWQKFSKEIAAENEEMAREKILCDLGSRHGLARRALRIRKITEIPAKDVTDSAVKHRIGAE